VLCFIVAQLPLGKIPFALKINYNNSNESTEQPRRENMQANMISHYALNRRNRWKEDTLKSVTTLSCEGIWEWRGLLRIESMGIIRMFHKKKL
jgi:hypothetical protein